VQKGTDANGLPNCEPLGQPDAGLFQTYVYNAHCGTQPFDLQQGCGGSGGELTSARFEGLPPGKSTSIGRAVAINSFPSMSGGKYKFTNLWTGYMVPTKAGCEPEGPGRGPLLGWGWGGQAGPGLGSLLCGRICLPLVC